MPNNIKTFAFLAILLLGASYASALWQGPTQTPPGGNVAVPLNIGNNAQIKEGNLTLNASNSFLNGLLVPYGKVGVGTTTITGNVTIISGNCYYNFKDDGLHSNCEKIED